MSKYTIIDEGLMLEDECRSIAQPKIMSGRKDRVVIACVMFDVPIVVEPAVYYQADRVHLIHYS